MDKVEELVAVSDPGEIGREHHNRGDRFVVCDPTYINANIGMTMPQFKTANPQVVRGAL